VILLNAETRMGSDLNAEFWAEIFKPKPKVKVVKKIISKNTTKIARSMVPRDKPTIIPASE